MITRLMLLLCLAQGLAARGASQAYSITDLGSPSWYYSQAHGLNRSGNVVGEYEPTNPPAPVKAFFYTNGLMTSLSGTGLSSIAYGINDSNLIVGQFGAAFNDHAFVYSNGIMTDLGALGFNNVFGYSSARAINRSGQIVGESSLSTTQEGSIRAVLYSGTNKSSLGVLGGDYSSARAINNSTVIVGESSVVPSPGVTNVHGFVYSNNVMTDLGTLGGGYSSASGINDSGAIVGETEEVVTAGVTNLRAFVCRSGVLKDLGTLGGVTSSASAVNSAGQIVGYATDANEVANAFLYDGSNMVNLINFIPPNSGWTNLTSADAINDQGQIAGTGFLADGEYHAFLLSPVSGFILLSSPILSDGKFSFTVQGLSGQRFAIQASTNLPNWWSLSTNTLTGTSTNFTDSGAADHPVRVYRAQLLP